MSLKLTDLQSSYVGEDAKFKYKDIDLDLEIGTSVDNPQLYKKVYKKDLTAIFDEAAIKNSLRTLFSTRPGEKPIDPNYGLVIQDYLFTNITDYNAQTIGSTIYNKISVYERRVTINQVNVIPDVDNQQYLISIKISYPNLPNRIITLNGVFSDNGFIG